MPIYGEWQPETTTLENAHAIAYPMVQNNSGVIPASLLAGYSRTVGALTTQERWSVWPDTKVSGGPITWYGTYGNDTYRYLRAVQRRDLLIVGQSDLQNYRQLRTAAQHPAIGAAPPGVIGIEYVGGSSMPVAESVVATPGVSATLVDASLTPVTATAPWHFSIKADAGLHATAVGTGSDYEYGARDDITVNPTTWAQQVTGIVETSGAISLSDTSFTLSLDATESFSVQIVVTVTSADPAQDNWRWRPRISSLTLQGNFTWPSYRYVYSGGGHWNTRQRQTLTGNAGGWATRQRGTGSANGGWPLRHRQTGL